MKITFLLYNAYGIGGTIRATTNLATALAERHEVEIVSYYRTADRMSLPVDPRVRVHDLVDLRPTAQHYAGEEHDQHIRGTVCPHDAPYTSKTPPSRLGERRLAEFLRRTGSDAVIATRPYLVCFLADHAPAGSYLRIGQEHLTHAFHREPLRRDQDAAIARLDAFVTVSEGDARAYRAALPDAPTRLTHIPNCCPAPEAEAATGASRTVVAAGRLIPVKRYDRLVDAFAKVAAHHPDWTLRIYGRGRERAKIRRRIDELGLHDNVLLMGPHTPIDTEWAKGALAAVSSSTESFGMTIVEAMRLGVPVVATDCDYGPREIITHGVDGLLVPAHGTVEDHLADGLCRLIENDTERFRMAEAARLSARRFLPDHIARQYEALLADLRPKLTTGTAPASRPRTEHPARTLRQRAGVLAERLGVAALIGKSLPPVTVDCRVATDGSLLFRVPTRDLPYGPWQLVLRPRDETLGPEIQLPFRHRPATEATTASDQAERLILHRSGRPPAEGRWDVHLRQGTDGRIRRVHAGLVETSRLVGSPVPHPSGAGAAAAVPYVTENGYLALRVWNRPQHAELRTVTTVPDGISLDGSLHGSHSRDHHYRLTALLRDGNGLSVHTRCHIDDTGAFSADLPLHRLAEHHQGHSAVWDIHLTPHDTTGPSVRPARLFGDIATRKGIDTFPTARHAMPGGALTVQPYLTANNNLALKTALETRAS
ncbi:glycosyltransferase family 4 protein [Streptomyces aurantiacus]|uniref:D-inositol 3-phosphate glycosyltransferase n=1 Tax=Streptomyces aurantiacus JA 4570 TaxID=1286094 RepID=S4AII0_9ACTN|nr:glycosyltransferase family 4 protein [Streptomyces aurantiacus]EPH41257.1 putative Exopolysaccharide phosphotransferase [Streptomyces aurantiacus JA 4570]